MSNNRDLQRRDMETLRDDWWVPVVLVAPDKTVYSDLLGDVRTESKVFDPETGGKISVKETSIVLLKSDLTRIPAENETWFIKYPDSLLDSGTLITASFDFNNVSEVGDSLGYIKIYPQEIET